MKNENQDVFKALADPNRRIMLDELFERKEITLYELTVRLTSKHNLTISRQAISKHLALLEAAELVVSEKEGKYRKLVFNPTPLEDIMARWRE
ncbi:helix-turn-helix domain-containing protein [Halobacillus litoralis]|uniref:ArsR/SmtB family transcription factor n=1 Tax=Halobacillus litoralis TaxID=45668 RepID=UPI001CD6166C|nr:helix-turn-helix domain-containing protein [Halobacillus litoralis]MCA0971854.1 helix-turn-helix domain-containing protein [Halobacillus litoralis]